VQAHLDRAPVQRRQRPAQWRDISDTDWNDWHWQLANRITSLEQLQLLAEVPAAEHRAVGGAIEQFPLGITPHYASLIRQPVFDLSCPIQRQCVPDPRELEVSDDEWEDPLAEESHMPVPGLTHRYPDRALLYTSHHCAVYCRFCNRRRKVGNRRSAPSRDQIAAGVEYIRCTPMIRDVLVSGGDPLSLSDKRLDLLLRGLREIDHVEIIRIATRMPVTLPQRITGELVSTLRRHHPIYISSHFNHLQECSPESSRALARLADAGCVLNNQMVLLAGVNDDPEMVRSLNQWLLAQRCQPYYIFQCDPAEGIKHFRTPVASGVAIIDALRGWTSGLAVPHFVVDLPGGGGKVSMQPDYLRQRQGKTLSFRNYKGEVFEYRER